jgi:hypothetical protein
VLEVIILLPCLLSFVCAVVRTKLPSRSKSLCLILVSLIFFVMMNCYYRFTSPPRKTTNIIAKTAVNKSLRKPVMCSNPDVVSTYKKIVEHWPLFKSAPKNSCQFFF